MRSCHADWHVNRAKLQEQVKNTTIEANSQILEY